MRKEELKRHIIVILALNQVGALARIISVFGRRGFNIETITASPSNYPGLTRITIIITATDSAMDQVLAQVEKVALSTANCFFSRSTPKARTARERCPSSTSTEAA